MVKKENSGKKRRTERVKKKNKKQKDEPEVRKWQWYVQCSTRRSFKLHSTYITGTTISPTLS